MVTYADFLKSEKLRKDTLDELCLSVLSGDVQSIEKLLDFLQESAPGNFATDRIKHCIEKYSDDPAKLCENVLSTGMRRCPKCSSDDTSVINYDPLFRDGDVICSKCKAYVRGYDAG